MSGRRLIPVVGDSALACLAPQTSLRFSPNGDVHACSVNSTHTLGRVDRDRLSDIWHGAQVHRLREAVAGGDGSLGCQPCHFDQVRGHRALTHAEEYDRFADDPAPRWPRRLEFAMSNTCNLTCIHCNGTLSSAIRRKRDRLLPIPDRYGEMFFEEIGTFLEHVEVATFLGGEPFLARSTRRVWDLLIESGARPEVHVTTNGTVWNDDVERYLGELRMNVAVSIDDVDAPTFELIREGAGFVQVMAARDRMYELTRSYGGSFIINHCMLRANVLHLYDMLHDADERGMNVHVIPVTYPWHLSVLGLPSDEIGRIVDELDRIEASRGPLGRNRDQWTTSVGYLRDLCDAVDGRRAAVATSHLETIETDEVLEMMIEHGGAAPIELEMQQHRVTSVDAPDWARPLRADEWLGVEAEEVIARLGTALGGEVTFDVSTPRQSVTLVDVQVSGPTTTHFRVAVIHRTPGDPADQLLYMSCPALVAASRVPGG